jgi:hypothetical protein
MVADSQVTLVTGRLRPLALARRVRGTGVWQWHVEVRVAEPALERVLLLDELDGARRPSREAVAHG